MLSFMKYVFNNSNMAAAHGFRAVRNISSFRANSIIWSLLVPVSKLRHVCSAASSQLSESSAAQSEVIKQSDFDSVDVHTTKNILEHPDFFEVHKLFTMKDLFNAKVHLGHHEGRWHPLMKRYLYGTREHQHIIDLNHTVEHLRLALNVLSHIAYRGGIILFVSTHPQFEELIQSTARGCGEYFVTRRWRGGTLTNPMMLTGMTKVADLIVFLHLPSLGRNMLAVKEAAQANVPSIGIVDSDCNPNLIMYPIPGNDDSPSAVELYCDLFKKAVLRAKEVRTERRSRHKEETIKGGFDSWRLFEEKEKEDKDVSNL